jgi:hypothetical protein
MLKGDRDLGFIDEHLDKLIVITEVFKDAFDGKEVLKPPMRKGLRLKNFGHATSRYFVD